MIQKNMDIVPSVTLPEGMSYESYLRYCAMAVYGLREVRPEYTEKELEEEAKLVMEKFSAECNSMTRLGALESAYKTVIGDHFMAKTAFEKAFEYCG